MSLFRIFQKSQDPPAPPAAKSIYDLARSVSERFGEVAHPAELRTDEAFQSAIRGAAALPYSAEDLETYALGENATIATLAVGALAFRNVPAADFLLRNINAFEGRWTKYFALQALHDLQPVPAALIGRVLVAMGDDWSDGYDRFLPQFARDFVDRRADAGEPLTFAGSLERASSDRLDEVAALLRRLSPKSAEPLRKELTSFRKQKTNLEFLRGVGTVWGKEDHNVGIVSHETLRVASDLIVQSLTGERRRSVLVIGEEGVGKTTIIRSAAQQLRDAGWTIFEAGSTEILSGQSYIGQIEARVQTIVENMSGARRVAWIVPNLHELQWAGAYREDPTSVLDRILPPIANGEVAVIGEVSAAAYTRLVERNRRVRSAFFTVRVEGMDEEDALELARKWMEGRGGQLEPQVLSETWQLTTQYLGTRAAPGSILGLLDLTHGRVGSNIAIDDVLVTLSQLTGLPLSILDERESLDPVSLRAHFASHVLGQPEAVDVLVERISMIKAALTDPTRPLGVFLFAGPTGTGKTEIAKTLATYLFGSPDRMLRIDMSELQTSDSLSRLTGDGDPGMTSLADEIRRQPFSVVLLDEIEKAHRNVLDLFLQVFDDGRLTDRRGNTADFRHAIVILTSNIGAAIQTTGRAGFSDAPSASFGAANVMKAIEREMRKEFVNRIDRVVVFRPLTRDTMRGILRKELADAFRRRGLRNRDWAVEWDDSAIEFLLDQGFTPDLGARPLKRAVERHLLTPLAERIVTRRAPSGDQFLFLRAEDGALKIDFVDPNATTPSAEPPPVTRDALTDLVLDARGSREEVERLQREHDALHHIVAGEAWRERKQIALSMTSLSEFWTSPERFEILGEAEMRDRIESALERARSLLARLMQGATSEVVRRVAQQLWLIGIAMRDLEEGRPNDALLLVEGDDEWATRVAAMYREWARVRGMRLEVLDRTPTRTIFSVSGFGAHTILANEAGLHVLEIPSNGRIERRNARVRVAVTREELQNGADMVVVRRYREEPSPLVRDSVRQWRSGRIDLVLGGNFDVMS